MQVYKEDCNIHAHVMLYWETFIAAYLLILWLATGAMPTANYQIIFKVNGDVT
jgi:hypothetical protein